MEMDSNSARPPQGGDHEHYEELCVIATSGSLTDREWTELKDHLRQCEICPELLREYRAIAKTVMPLVAAGDESRPHPEHSAWSLLKAKQELLGRIARAETSAPAYTSVPVPSPHSLLGWRRWWQVVIPSPQVAVRYAAATALFAAIVLSAYYVGNKRALDEARTSLTASTTVSLQTEVERLGQERVSLDRAVTAKTEEIGRLTQELQRRTAVSAQLSALHQQYEQQFQQQGSMIADLNREKTSLLAERDSIKQQLEAAESALVPVQRQLDTLQQERNRNLLRLTSLETRIEELSARLKDSDESIQRQEQFLASDRDIRELMGARDLYIADVFDVDRSGKTQKAFGRVFYTAGKSLIFYAFDLDRTPGVHDASFQAWGRRGPADKRPLNMGVFYLDNEANKRWVLRFEDPRMLAQVDAVFVTVEPRGGRQKPGGRQLLFASLRTPPNHP
jgi:hypothetical protein